MYIHMKMKNRKEKKKRTNTVGKLRFIIYLRICMYVCYVGRVGWIVDS